MLLTIFDIYARIIVLGAYVLMSSSSLTIYEKREKEGFSMSRIRQRRKPTYYQDIAPRFVIAKTFALTAIVAFVLSGIVWLAYLTADKPEVVQEKNQKIEAFNALPQNERQLVKDLTSNLDWQDEDDTMLELDEAFSLQSALTVQKWMNVITIIVMFVAFFCYYCSERESGFFLADFPLGRVYGWILLVLCLPFGWLFLLVSRIRMWRYFRKKEIQDKTTDDAAETESDQEETIEETTEVTAKKTTATDEEAYVTLRMEFAKECSERAAKNLDSSIDYTRARIRDYGQKIQGLQKDLGQLQSKRSQLEQRIANNMIMTRQIAIDELKEIQKMRGVEEITPDLEYGSLEITIQVRVPYQGAQYDFGDYLVKFQDDSCTTRLLRSGVKEDAGSHAPFYQDGAGFCFGDRKSEIDRYASEGRIVEALTLIVDCMHSVNEGDEEEIPDCFKRISKPKKRKGGKKR